MPKWEYLRAIRSLVKEEKTFYITNINGKDLETNQFENIDDFLKKVGIEGWELVESNTHISKTYKTFMKSIHLFSDGSFDPKDSYKGLLVKMDSNRNQLAIDDINKHFGSGGGHIVGVFTNGDSSNLSILFEQEQIESIQYLFKRPIL